VTTAAVSSLGLRLGQNLMGLRLSLGLRLGLNLVGREELILGPARPIARLLRVSERLNSVASFLLEIVYRTTFFACPP
jgi:hypothetical protein